MCIMGTFIKLNSRKTLVGWDPDSKIAVDVRIFPSGTFPTLLCVSNVSDVLQWPQTRNISAILPTVFSIEAIHNSPQFAHRWHRPKSFFSSIKNSRFWAFDTLDAYDNWELTSEIVSLFDGWKDTSLSESLWETSFSDISTCSYPSLSVIIGSSHCMPLSTWVVNVCESG